MKKYLVVEDDADIANLLRLNLSQGEIDVTPVGNGLRAFELIKQQHWDLIILDINLPGMDGLELCKRLRAEQPYVPVIMLTSRGTELDRVLGLELGADDYLIKPFSLMELQARIKAVFRRIESVISEQDRQEVELNVLDLQLNKKFHSVLLKDRSIHLTVKEFDLLWFLASQPQVVFSRSDLLEKVWGYGHDGYEHTVNSHINRLRSKLEPDPNSPKYVQTVWGIGYRFAG